jgi:hypothetical protein
MSDKPWQNAVLAMLYIIGIVLIIQLGSFLIGPEDNILIPVFMLSLLVLSAAVMGFLIFYRPVVLLLDGKRADALSLFWKTLAIFAGLVAAVFIASATLFA